MKKILFVVGSLRKGSFNQQLADYAKTLLEGKAEVTFLDYKDVPVFSQDLETPVLESVAKVRKAVLDTDAIWIFSPVYNFSIPGSVKNLLDWLSRAMDLTDTRGASALQDKIITVSSVANGGHENLFAIYNDLLPFIRTKVVGEFTAAKVNPEAWGSGVLTISEDTKLAIANQVKALLD